MRVLRLTEWTSPDPSSAGVVVVRDSDLTDTFESALVAAFDKYGGSGHFVTWEIFNMRDASIAEATIEAGKRTSKVANSEIYQASLYFWVVGQWSSGLIRRGGTIGSDKPLDLTVDQLKGLMEQLARHPACGDRGWIAPAKDSTFVTLFRGKVNVG